MSGLNTTHRQFDHTLKDKFWDQKMMACLIQTEKSTINDVLMKNKTSKEMRKRILMNVDYKVFC